MIEVEGVVVEAMPNTTFQVDIGNGHTILAHMKVRPSVKPMCEKCKIIRRKGRVMVICENPKHKQRQG